MIFNLCKKKISGFIVPNNRVGTTFGRPYLVVTDYIRTEKPHMKSFNQRKWDICIVGGITRDKGVLEAMEYLSRTNLKVLVAGRIIEKELEEKLNDINSQNDNIECHFSFVSDEDYINYIQDSRFALLNYQGTYMDRSSGAVLDNIFFGTPVIGHKSNALQVIEDSHVGYTYDGLDKVNFQTIVTEDNFNRYSNNINLFFTIQQEYKQKLIQFLKLS